MEGQRKRKKCMNDKRTEKRGLKKNEWGTGERRYKAKREVEDRQRRTDIRKVNR